MLYELRVYTVVPGRMPALLARFKGSHDIHLAKAWDRSDRILDEFDRQLQRRADLYSELEFSRRPRGQMGRVSKRP